MEACGTSTRFGAARTIPVDIINHHDDSIKNGSENSSNFSIRELGDGERTAESRKLKGFMEKYEILLSAFEEGTLRKEDQFDLGETPDALPMHGSSAGSMTNFCVTAIKTRARFCAVPQAAIAKEGHHKRA